MTDYKELFEPAQIGTCKIKNKTSMAPMGPVGYADAFGGFNQRLQDYYVERAKYGVGLIFTGICSVDTNIEGLPSMGLPCPTTQPLAFIHSTYQMNERVHAYGTKIFLQLTGGLGRSALPGFVSKQIAPSEQGNRFDPNAIHREMTKEEIMNLIQKFIASAVVAKKAGFDGVEIHAVHEGYLLDQFAIEIFNHRDDEFGGSLENRLRVSTEIVKGIKKFCGPDFPVSLRYSLKSCMKALRQGGLPGEEYEEAGKDIEEGIAAAKILVDAGYDALNVDAGTYDSWYWNHPPMYFEDGCYREFGEILKKEVDVPIILAGKMEDPKMAVEALGTCCDIVSYGRQLLTDAEYIEKLRTGRLDEVRPCLGCHEGCLGRIGNAPVSCAVNPACGRETIYGIVPAAKKKRVLVIGGGVAGLEAARVAAESGHEVILCEKSDALGGNLIPGGVPHFKRNDHKLIQYYKRQLELLGVDVHYQTEVTPESVSQYKPDVLVAATGSHAKTITLPGSGKPVNAEDILLEKSPCGSKVLVVGGGLVGCETALWLAQQGKEVNVVEVLPEILGGHGALPHMNEFMLRDLLKYHKIGIHTNAKVLDTNADTATIQEGDQSYELPAETIVLSVGYESNDKLYDELKDLDIPVYNVGDSSKVHNIMYSIWNAYEVARNL
ncbi:FAD-dependent oxidoreductase [Hominibacterium faecale]|uniref:oxidoreductase n=1 Tax=Hominibacterium faecale TaxID=2839743 RepID=UPI0022B29676|nr:FAD-dependent oxidoreductase [Hominibacterium faecale]